MDATLMLADHAQVADGKLFINGGGWSQIGPDPAPYAIAALIHVPWDRTNARHTMLLELLDADGEPVTVQRGDGERPLRIEGEFELGRPAGVRPGTRLTVPFAFLVAPTPIPPGSQYVWALTIDGEGDERWRLPFVTRPARRRPA